MESLVLWLLLGAAAGGASGYVVRNVQLKTQSKGAEAKAQKVIDDAKTEAKEAVLKAKEEALKITEDAKKDEKDRRNELAEMEKRLVSRDEALEKRMTELDKKRDELDADKKEIEENKNFLRDLRDKQEKALEKIAKLPKEKAKDTLLAMIEKDYAKDVTEHIRKVKDDAKEDAESKAREIIATAIQRVASEHTAETTVTSISIPNDEMKGRIIGREGRNIQAIEKLTGCDIVVDDTPETIVISGFDPVRRQVARLALERLIQDGRIHPAKIEEAVEKAQADIDKIVKEAGERAAYETGVAGLPAELVKVLGRLKFRTSFAQNVLEHSVETANLAAAIASEMGADVAIAKKAGLLHDVGKAIDQEMGGSHAVISKDICKKFGIDEKVQHAVEAHHEDVPPKTVEAIIVLASDAISASRPGARRDSIENYIKRLTELEAIANSFKGVEKSFAIQAGREVRVMVVPEKIDDLGAEKLAKDVARKIESDLKFPGQIKVNVIRETRAVEYAK
ncbi:MAG: ribonuclease Y [Patescibacteria group bacterium]|nr:ribonuclease Y [Patescibacteria group bacterium]